MKAGVQRSRGRVVALFVTLTVALTGCDLDVKNPGAILDEDLNEPNLMPVVAAGVSSEFSDVIDGLAFTIARLTDEMVGSGSYTDTGLLRRGIIRREDSGGEWDQLHEAAWSAEEAITRFRNVLGDEAEGNPLTARTFLFEGLAHRLLGEVFCEVAYDAGPAEPRTGAFERAVTAFENALANAVTDDADTIAIAAYGGLAQAYVGLDNWDAAVENAMRVPTGYVYAAIYNENGDTNVIFSETHNRPEMSAWKTIAGSFDPPDPRAPYTICGLLDENGDIIDTGRCQNAQGASGDKTPHWRQDKYPDLGANIPVVKGTEMRLIEAEAALLDGDLATFTARVNDVRTFHDLEPIPVPTAVGSLDDDDPNDAWSILDRERFLTLWLEGRRLWDLHRWDHPFLDGGMLVPNYDVIERRDSCFPISEDECDLNENLQCT